MKFLLLFCLLISNFAVNAQYEVKSRHLKDPSSIMGYIDSSAQFWWSAYDHVQGGFFTLVDRMGNKKSNLKEMLTQSRNAYGMIRAYQLTGNDDYLSYARGALDYMYLNHWDVTNGGWINNPSNSSKTAFFQHYALLGIIASYEVTQDTTDWHWLMKGYEVNETKLWDDHETNFGYYNEVSNAYTNKNGKSFNATVDAITTHALSLWLLTEEAVYKTRLQTLVDNILDHLIPSMDQNIIGFAEEYETNWNIKTWDTDVAMGHVLKTSWCLARIQHIFPEENVLTEAKLLTDEVYNYGYDHEFGGPYKDYNRINGQMLMWGQDTAKAWWQMQQAVMSGLELYDLTGDDQYLQMADETLHFFMEYFVDHVYGEIYADRFKDGGYISAWGSDKGNGYKAAYHSIETGYYVYLYGSLFYKNEPVTLYYKFEARDENRTMKMTPIAIADNRLIIESVTLDGTEYTHFNAITRELSIEANVEGEFAITYSPVEVTSVTDAHSIPSSFEIVSAYPNPFNPVTSIKWNQPAAGTATINAFNLLGQLVFTSSVATTSGIQTAKVNLTTQPSGLYLISVDSGGLQTKAVKVTLIK